MKTKKIIWSIAFLMAFPIYISGQYNKMLDVLEDTDTETVDGKLAIRFFDAKTGNAVNDALVAIEGVGDFTTDLKGRVLIDKLKDGKYAFRFKKDGYVSAIYTFEVIAETIFFNRFSVCPVTELGALRIILDWDRSPADLDLHLVKEERYHISYQNSKAAGDGSAQLDRDDRDAYGPETITLNKTDNKATYTCYVHDFSHSSKNHSRDLSRSKAVVRVYNNNELTDTFFVLKDRTGNKWSVFQIRQGKVEGMMTLGDGI